MLAPGGGGRYGVHQAHDAEGNILEWDSGKDDFDGAPAYVEGEEGVYKEATITIFRGNIQASCTEAGCGNSKGIGVKLSAEESMAGTFSHESHHNTNKEFIQDLKNRREGKPDKNIGAHDNIRPKKHKVWKEMDQANKN